MPTISVAIQKGGSGKTTTTINLAAAYREMGKKVLLIDMDPQSNMSQALGFEDESNETVYTLIRQVSSGGKADIRSIIKENNGMHVIPAALDLANAELELVSTFGREHILKGLIKPIKNDYDFILIDCPPAIGMLTVNSLAASDYVLIPLQAEFLPMNGVRSFMRSFNQVKTHLNKSLAVAGFVITKYDKMKNMTHTIEEKLIGEFGKKVLGTHIRTNIELAKAQQKGTDIFTHKKSSNGAEDYMNLAKELLKKL